jgi:hypothetical protein
MTLDSQNKKDTLRGVFTRSASSYERIRYFPVFGEWLVGVAQFRKGQRYWMSPADAARYSSLPHNEWGPVDM